jgi:hypothetical protein
MHIIGKISEENHISLTIMPWNYVRIGRLVLSSVNMMKVAFFRQLVSSVMVGRSLSTILSTTKQSHARTRSVMVTLNALTIMVITIRGSLMPRTVKKR